MKTTAYKVKNPTTPKLRKSNTTTVVELVRLQRVRRTLLKFRIMLDNRLQAVIAGNLGYHNGMDEKARRAKFVEAAAFIKRLRDNPPQREAMTDAEKIVDCISQGIGPIEGELAVIESKMLSWAKKLHIVNWINHKDQAGFGLPSLAYLIGETGDLANYSNPGKVWRRMGCAPFTKQTTGETLMGSTWKRGGSANKDKLSSVEWEEFGYCPRRRSMAYLIGENFIKQNGVGPYRRRWLDAKLKAFKTHPEWAWKPCEKCKTNGHGVCGTCGGLGKKCGRAHMHGMLLATKLLLKNLWIEWNR